MNLLGVLGVRTLDSPHFFFVVYRPQYRKTDDNDGRACIEAVKNLLFFLFKYLGSGRPQKKKLEGGMYRAPKTPKRVRSTQ
jgi:hypothetical protein